MKENSTTQLQLGNLEAAPLARGAIILNKEKFIQVLSEIDSLYDINFLKNKIITLKQIISFPKNDREGITNIDGNGDTISLRKDILISELDQILKPRLLK